MNPESYFPENYFADTVAAGWRPVNPCADERELATLEVSGIRGDCIFPLLQEGDVVYIDRNMRPEPGDVVCFALGQRGVDAQNSGRAEGRLLDQPMWKCGDQWAKLYGVRLGLDMLYERHGAEMTATLACCERPDDSPVLHPVRQVRRNGRLLFCRDSYSAQIGLNAATVVNIANSTGSGTVSMAAGWNDFNLITGTSADTPTYDCSAIVTCTLLLSQQSGSPCLNVAASYFEGGAWARGSVIALPVNANAQSVTVHAEFPHLGSNAGGGYFAGFSVDNVNSSSVTLVQGQPPGVGPSVGLGSTLIEFVLR